MTENSCCPDTAGRQGFCRWWSLPTFRRSPSVAHEAGWRLVTFSRTFAERSARMEQDFVELSRALRQLYSIATKLTGLISQRAGALRGALEQSRLAGAEGLMAQPVQELRRTLEAI